MWCLVSPQQMLAIIVIEMLSLDLLGWRLYLLCLEPEQRAESWWVEKEFSVMVKSQTDLNSNPDITY